MRIYYAMEAEGRRCHVRTALGVDARAWNRLHRRVRDWRRELESRCAIPADGPLRPGELLTAAPHPAPSCACDCHQVLTPRQGAEVVAEGLRVIEDVAVETGGVAVINVCLDRDDVPACRRVSLDRLFNRINATASQEGGHALVIFGQEPEESVVRTYRRLRNYNPVPTRYGACRDAWSTRNLPIERVIGGPAFRDPGADCLLQTAGLVAHALLWQEEPPAHGDEATGVCQAFAVLDHALNRRAAGRDPQGVVRR